MLHQDVLMKDIDVNHWRNLQALLLDSAKARRRIIVIHDEGVVEKIAHSHRLPLSVTADRVVDPRATAERLYREHEELVDFVAVFERHAFDAYFARVQASWDPEEDLDEFVHRTYALMDEYPEGIVTYPEPARVTLGLQWRLGAGYEEVKVAIARFIRPASTAVFGVLEGGSLWATLVLSFDEDRRIDVATTLDPSELGRGGGRAAITADVLAVVKQRYRPCAFALFVDLEGARALLAAKDKASVLRELQASGRLAGSRYPKELAELVGA